MTTYAPWTIKAFSTATREKIIFAAQRDGVTIGKWLERCVAEWAASPASAPHDPAKLPTAELMEIIKLAIQTKAAGLPGVVDEAAHAAGKVLAERVRLS